MTTPRYNPYDDLEVEYKLSIQGIRPELGIVDKDLYMDGDTALRIISEDSSDDPVKKESDHEEESLENSLSGTKHLKRYQEAKAKDTAAKPEDWRLAQYTIVQRIRAGEFSVEDMALLISTTPGKKSTAANSTPQRPITEKQILQKIYSVMRKQKKHKSKHYNGFPLESFDNFYQAFRTYKSRLTTAKNNVGEVGK